ncbi:copper chaperone PCu(A)C [Allorhizobium pseudoryzae]|uniref:copper chaperone PCu(A)C n=1 Tax=Allorhizobium pseudoryzae TaxID=379684 RepID=UPI003D033E51
MKTTRIFLMSSLSLVAMTGSALAHVTLVNGTAKPESYTVVQLQVPHGCAGKPTNEVRVTLPDGFYGAKPQPKAGWDLEIIKGDYAKPYDNHGTKVSSGPVEIRWKNGNLPDDNYDVFAFQGKIAGVADGASLAFRTIQLCGDLTEKWDEVAAPGTDPHSLKDPAPLLKIASDGKPAPEMDHSAMGHGAMNHDAMGHGAAVATDEAATMQPVKLGSLSLSAAYLKAMLPGQPVGGGYVTIANAGAEADRLVSVSSPRAGTVELHEMSMTGDVMVMRPLANGIEIPAGATVELKPGGFHLMFMKVATPFAKGDTVPVTFVFEKAGKIEVELPVAAAGPGGHQHN